MGRVVHFDIHAADPERSREFYEQVFGWTFQQWGEQPYWVIFTGDDEHPGINGGLTTRRGDPPQPGAPVNAFVATVQVEDLDGALEAVPKAGGEIRVPRTPLPHVGWQAFVADPDGNLLGLMQPDETAGRPDS
jgi:predicted enzyme related to lactoylglutathione lyase